MRKHLLIALCVAACFTQTLHAQGKYTASRAGDLQVGVDFVGGNADYAQNVKGYGGYATFDFSRHFGAELDFKQANGDLGNKVYERTYEVGGRYVRQYGRFAPYVRAMYGRGVFNFQFNDANLAYNMFAGGAGVDIRVKRYLSVRGDFEYEKWLSFPPNGLTPELYTIGVAYHFPGELRRGKHY